MINLQHRQNRPTWRKTFSRIIPGAAVASILAGSASLALAGNILVNPGFEADGNHGNGAPITGWSFSISDPFWINVDTYAHSGGNYYKVWGQFNGSANYDAVWQDNSALPSSTYQADGWLFTLGTDIVWSGDGLDYAWLEVSFRDASNNILALYKSDLFNPTLGSIAYATDTWYDMPITNICQTTPPYSVMGSTNVLVAPPGTVKVRFQHTLYQALYGGGSVYFDDATLNQTGGPVPPQLTQVYPGDMLLASNRISFHVTSPSSTPIAYTNIHLVVNGTDVSSSPSLSMTGSSPDISVTYTGLQANVWTYTATVTVTDAYAFTASATMNFDTVNPAYVWEAEDYDFTNGLSITSPVLSSTPQPDSYFGTMGTSGVDYSKPAGASGPHLYRPNDDVGTDVAGDKARPNFLAAQLTDPGVKDYNCGYISTGDWMNYTRDYPTGTFNVYARLAGGAGATVVALDSISGGTTNNLGSFQFTGSDWGAYNYVALVDTNGNLLPFNFGGVQTLRVTLTSGGDNMNFFMLVPAQTGLPFLSNISPTNGTIFASGNSFSFTATSTTTINNSGIHLLLNGSDVTAGLSISGTATTKNVSYPGLAPNNIYTAVISVTNASGVGVTRTVQFDTISTSNFYVKIEDFDYDGGQYDTNNNGLLPNGYLGQNGAISNIDYYHTSGGNYPYRLGLATETTADVPLPGFSTGSDYDVGNFNTDDWGNYTRNYPAGKYLIYGRLAGYGLVAYLDRVTGGWGTTSQTTQRLGTWSANPNGWQNWAWVPLTDAGLVAPAIVTVGGTETLRVTSGGNVNANYFMLIPAAGIHLSVSRAGGNLVLSFPTQLGVSYRVLYRTSLTTGDWVLLTTLPGDGTVKSVSDPIGVGQRFYEVVAP